MTGQIIVAGNLGEDPQLRFTQKGQAVASFSIADTPRHFNNASQEWEDGETMWYRGELWDKQAENVAASLTKGMRVLAYGELAANSFETREGEKRTSTKFRIKEIGPSLLRATVKGVERTTGNGGQGGGQGAVRGGNGGGRPAQNESDETPF